MFVTNINVIISTKSSLIIFVSTYTLDEINLFPFIDMIFHDMQFSFQHESPLSILAREQHGGYRDEQYLIYIDLIFITKKVRHKIFFFFSQIDVINTNLTGFSKVCKNGTNLVKFDD